MNFVPIKVQQALGIRRLVRNEMLPRGWGLCWEEDYRNVRVIAPIGLNLLYALARAAYMQVQGWIPLKLYDAYPFTPADDVSAANKIARIIRMNRPKVVVSEGNCVTVTDPDGLDALQYAERRLRGWK